MKSISSFFIFILFLSSITFAYTATEYLCAQNNDNCYLEDSQSIYLLSCQDGEKCNEKTNENSQCEPITSLLHEGESCTQGTECISGICSDNKCSTLADGETCNNSKECAIGSYCSKSNKCAQLLGKDADCTDDVNSCGLGLTCSNNKCVVLYSLDNGELADNALACKSTMRFQNEIESIKYCGQINTVEECNNQDHGSFTATLKGDYSYRYLCNANWGGWYRCSELSDNIKKTPDCFAFTTELAKYIEDIQTNDKYYYYYLVADYATDKTFGVPSLRDKWVECYHKTKILAAATDEDKTCVRNYYINQIGKIPIRFVKADIRSLSSFVVRVNTKPI